MSQDLLPGEDASSALALVNTRHNSASGKVEHLSSTGEARQWLIDRGLLEPDLPFGPDDLERLRALRSTLRDLLKSRAGGARPAAESVTTVNTITSAAPVAPQLSWTAAGPSVAVLALERGVDQSLAALANDAIQLVCGPLAERLLICGAPGCVRMIIQDHPRRRWCSRGCGDRVRAARYYAKNRPSEERPAQSPSGWRTATTT